MPCCTNRDLANFLLQCSFLNFVTVPYCHCDTTDFNFLFFFVGQSYILYNFFCFLVSAVLCSLQYCVFHYTFRKCLNGHVERGSVVILTDKHA